VVHRDTICFNSVEWVDDNIISLERFGIGD